MFVIFQQAIAELVSCKADILRKSFPDLELGILGFDVSFLQVPRVTTRKQQAVWKKDGGLWQCVFFRFFLGFQLGAMMK